MMYREMTDKTGALANVKVVGHGPIRSYTLTLAATAEDVGRADFLEPDVEERSRIFFHTEVDPAFKQRGLAGLLIRAALSDAISEGILVVPVCPLFKEHLRKHGDAFLADGGRFRSPRPADLESVRQAMRGA